MFYWKNFEWIKLDIPELETVEGDTRYYKVDDDTLLPSMTSLLSLLDDGGIDEWIKRVGEDEAKRVVDSAVARGNNLHDLSERYLMNTLQRSDVKGPGSVLFNRNKRYLDELGPIVAIESPLYSRKYKYAGRVDCIAFHNKDLCIVDHKNTRRKVDFKKSYARKKVFGYMIQTCGYARAFHEMFPHLPKPSHGILIFGNYQTMDSTRFKFELEPLEKELDIVIDAYYGKRDIKESKYFSI